MAMAGAHQWASASRRASPSPPLLLLLCGGFLFAVLVLLAPAAGERGDDGGETTEELPVAFSSSWPAAGRRALPRPAAERSSSSSWRAGRTRTRGRWNSAGFLDGKHEVPSGPNPDSNRSICSSLEAGKLEAALGL